MSPPGLSGNGADFDQYAHRPSTGGLRRCQGRQPRGRAAVRTGERALFPGGHRGVHRAQQGHGVEPGRRPRRPPPAPRDRSHREPRGPPRDHAGPRRLAVRRDRHRGERRLPDRRGRRPLGHRAAVVAALLRGRDRDAQPGRRRRGRARPAGAQPHGQGGPPGARPHRRGAWPGRRGRLGAHRPEPRLARRRPVRRPGQGAARSGLPRPGRQRRQPRRARRAPLRPARGSRRPRLPHR